MMITSSYFKVQELTPSISYSFARRRRLAVITITHTNNLQAGTKTEQINSHEQHLTVCLMKSGN